MTKAEAEQPGLCKERANKSQRRESALERNPAEQNGLSNSIYIIILAMHLYSPFSAKAVKHIRQSSAQQN